MGGAASAVRRLTRSFANKVQLHCRCGMHGTMHCLFGAFTRLSMCRVRLGVDKQRKF